MSTQTPSEEVLDMLTDYGCIYQNMHFVYKSGNHGPQYINLDPIFVHPARVVRLGELLAQPFTRHNIQVVCGPAVGGIPLAYAVARAFFDRPSVVWADKLVKDEFEFARAGFKDAIAGKRVLITEDMLTTGGSVAAVSNACKQAGASEIFVSAICNRGGVTAQDCNATQLESITTVDFIDIDIDLYDCPDCTDRVPIVEDLGHPGLFLSNNIDFPTVKILS